MVFPVGASESPAAVLHSDLKGRFSLEGLPAGSYILALSKPGYRIQLAQANSALLSLLSIHLAPAEGVDVPQAQSGAMDWVLRLPVSDVLKEEDTEPASSTASSPDPVGPGILAAQLAAGHRLPVRADLNQWYTSSLAALGAGAGSPESTGRSTELTVGGELQGRGNWELQGLARSLSTEGSVTPQAGRETDEGSNRLKVAMNYRLTPADAIQFQARFDRDRYHSEGSLADPAAAAQEVRTLGYAANYTRKVNDDHRWRVGTDLLRAEARVPQAIDGPLTGAAANDLTDWRWSAAADYQASLPRDHRLSVAARTRIYRYEMRDEGWAVAPIQAGASRTESGDKGWSLSFSGEDSWKLAGPVQLLLGLETHVSESWGKSVLLIPRLGARRESAWSLVQGWILVRTDGGGPEGEIERGDSSNSPLGYHAEIARRFDGDWVVRGHVQRNALMSGDLGVPADSAAPQRVPIAVLADPDAWSQEIGFSVTKDLRGVRGTLESDGGRVVGRVGGTLSEAPVLVLAEGSTRYLALRASADILKTDTRLHFDYTKLEGSDVPGAEVSSQIDLIVFQPISIVSNRGVGSWRLLFGYQGLTRAGGPQDPLPRADASEKVHRFSGGVGVTF